MSGQTLLINNFNIRAYLFFIYNNIHLSELYFRVSANIYIIIYLSVVYENCHINT